MLRAFPLLLIGLLASCESEQVFVDRIVHDTIWVQGTPVKITETKTDTVWVTRTVNDTITVTQQVIVTDTVLLEIGRASCRERVKMAVVASSFRDKICRKGMLKETMMGAI